MIQRLRHTLILKDEVGLFEFQRKNLNHFTKKLLSISKNDEFEIDGRTDLANDLVMGNST